MYSKKFHGNFAKILHFVSVYFYSVNFFRQLMMSQNPTGLRNNPTNAQIMNMVLYLTTWEPLENQNLDQVISKRYIITESDLKKSIYMLKSI